MKNILNVLRFEYKGFVCTKSFRAVTIIFVLGIILVTSIPQIAGGIRSVSGDEGGGVFAGGDSKAALVLSGEALTNEIYQKAFSGDALAGTGANMWIDLSADPPEEDVLIEAVRSGEYLFAIRYSGGETYEYLAPGNRMTAYIAVEPMNELITRAAREAEIATLPASEQETAKRISSITAEPDIIDIGGNAQNNYWIGYVLIMFLMYTILGYSNYVSSTVVTEKTSKAMELLITSVKPLHLMIGKVIGVGLAALTQVGALVCAFAVGIAANYSYWLATGSVFLGVTQGGAVGASIAFIVIIYFILGFFLYAFLIAAFSSTVTKPEEAATVVTLPMVLLLASLFIGFLTLFGTGSRILMTGLSYMPFFTPIVMIARYTMGDASEGQLLIGAAIMFAAVIVVAILASKIFRVGVMLYGVKATPKQILKALKNS